MPLMNIYGFPFSKSLDNHTSQPELRNLNLIVQFVYKLIDNKHGL